MARKRRTREHVIADLSINHIERYALLAGFTFDHLVHDYGLDLLLNTFDREGFVEPGQVLFQIKASDSPIVVSERQSLACRVSRSDLERWREELLPVILVMYDAPNDIAYWVLIEEEPAIRRVVTRDRPSVTVTVHIPMTNRVDVRAMEQIALIRDEVRSRTRRETRRHGQ